MFSLEIECDPDDRDLLIAELWEQGSAGIVELASNRVRAFFEDAADRAASAKLYPGIAAPRRGGSRLGAILARPAAADGGRRAIFPGSGMA